MVVVAVQHKHPVLRFVTVATVMKVVVAAVPVEEFPLVALVRPAPMAAVFGELHLATALQVERLELLEPLVQHKLVRAVRVAAVVVLGTLLLSGLRVALVVLAVAAVAVAVAPEMGLTPALAVTAVVVMSLCIRTEV
jgi:hypothetical protein